MATSITTLSGLQAMRDNLAGDYVLATDIDASATSGWNELIDKGVWAASTGYVVNDYVLYDSNGYHCKETHDSGETFEAGYWHRTSKTPGDFLGFDPVGQDAARFTGSFNGKGYSTSGLYINRDFSSPYAYIGLFGYVDSGTIENVTMANVNFTQGVITAGAIAGALRDGIIRNCHASGAIIGDRQFYGGIAGDVYGTSLIEECSSAVIVTGDDYTGGLVGPVASGGTVQECYVTGQVISEKRSGGFVAYNSGTIKNCYTLADISGSIENVGGFVDINTATGIIENCYSIGLVDAPTGMGGFCRSNSGTISNCFWNTETSGQSTSDGGTGKLTIEMKQLLTFQNAAWDINTTSIYRNDGYPFLGWEVGNSSIWLLTGGVGQKDIITLEAFRNIEMSAMGRIYIDEEGNLKYESRYARNL